MKNVKVEDLIVGKKYVVECGCWKAPVNYVESFNVGNKTKYRFTFGDVENWLNQFNIVGFKSSLKIKEIES